MITLKEDAGESNLFLLHGRRGQAFVSPHFVDVLGRSMSVLAIRARGLRPGEEPHLSVGDMAAEYMAEIRKRQPRGPYFLASICAGALVAVEIASRLAGEGEAVAPVIAIDPPSLMIYTARARRRSVDPGRFREALRNGDFQRLESYHSVAIRKKIKPDRRDPLAAATKHASVFALYNHRPSAYDGEVLIVASRRRLNEMGRARKYRIPGRLRFFHVAEDHRQVFEPGNRETMGALRECVDYMLCSGTGVRREAPGAGDPGEALTGPARLFDEWRLTLDWMIHRRPVLKAGSDLAGSLLRRLVPRRRSGPG